MKKLLALVLAMVMCLSLLAACGNKEDTANTDTKPGTANTDTKPGTSNPGTADADEETYQETITIAYASDVSEFDFYQGKGGSSAKIFSNMVHDDLAYYDPFAGTLTWKLATSIEQGADATVWTIKLREGVVSHDGKPLTAEDLIYTFDKVIDGTQVKMPASALANVYEAGNCKKIDDLTVEVKLKNPAVDFPYIAAEIRLYSKEAFDAGVENAGWIGFGPMKYHSNTPGVEYKVERFDDYYEGARKTKYIVVRTMPELDSQLAALQAGEIYWYGSMRTSDMPVFDEDETIDYHLVPGTCVYSMNWNYNSKYAQDPYILEAVAMCVDKEAVNMAMVEGLGEPVANVVSDACPDYVEVEEAFPYDLEKAKATLAKSSFKPEEIELTVLYYAWCKPVAEVIQFSIEQLGIKTVMREVDGSSFRIAAQEGNFDVTCTYYDCSANINYLINRLFRVDGGANYYGYQPTAEIKALLDKYDAEATTAEKAMAISAELQKACAKDPHYVALIKDCDVLPYASALQGFEGYTIGFNDMSRIYVVE